MSVSLSQSAAVACVSCNVLHETARLAATCLCKRRRYVTTLGVRLGKVPSKEQLTALTGQSAVTVSTWYNSRLRAAQQNTSAAPAAHQLAALAYLDLLADGNPSTAVQADQALIAWFKSSAATSAAVWDLAQHVSASQQPQLALF